MTRPTALYRLYGIADELLYIGISYQPEIRWIQHRATKPWWPDVRRFTFEWHPDWDTAYDAETAAVAAEHPLHNIVGATWSESVEEARRGLKVGRAPGPTPNVPFRVNPELWAAFGVAVGDGKRSAVLRDFMRAVVEEMDTAEGARAA